MKTHLGVLTLLAISMTMLIVGAGGGLVSAQIPSPCAATLSYPGVPAEYSNPNFPLVIPVSASCTTYYGTQLYATGTAYDVTSNTGLGSASTLLSSVNGGTQFNGQLGFNVPPTSPGDSIQISVSIYNGQGGNLLTETSETIPAGAGVQQPAPPLQPVQQTTTTTVTEAQYPYANPYPTAYPSPYQPNQPQYQAQGHRTHYFSQAFAQYPKNTNLFDYIVIVAILAAVIIATAGLVLVARRRQQPQPTWYPMPPPPPR